VTQVVREMRHQVASSCWLFLASSYNFVMVGDVTIYKD